MTRVHLTNDVTVGFANSLPKRTFYVTISGLLPSALALHTQVLGGYYYEKGERSLWSSFGTKIPVELETCTTIYKGLLFLGQFISLSQ